jgi:predicted glycogen debranching enzyme
MTTRRLVDRISRRLELPSDPAERSRLLIETEWLVTNGLGGYASSSMANVITRRYHGVLVAALPNPMGRVVMLNHLGERLVMNGSPLWLNDEDLLGGPLSENTGQRIQSARLEAGLPVWEYEVDGVRVEKRVMMPHRQNTVYVTYRLLEGPDSVRLELVPAIHRRRRSTP